MTSIIEFSNEPKFTIKTVCTKTGIRPVTLRAWERRHEVLTPYRSDNRYRLYSERDVAILRWLKNQVDNGVSISSAVGELKILQHSNQWPDAIPSSPTPQTKTPTTPPVQYTKPLFEALIHHDEMNASEIMRQVHSEFDLATLFSKILIPVLVDIGEAWYNGKIRVATEHFASSFLRGKLLSLLQAYPSRRNAAYILIGCAPTEQHELGSLMLAILLRTRGYRVEYLGPDIPLDDLVDYASYEHPDMVVLSSSIEFSARELKNFQKNLSAVRNPPIFGYGGRSFVNNPQLCKQIDGHYLGDTIEEAGANINELLKKKA
jgi:methanogenic corrinoid protein MtbC1